MAPTRKKYSKENLLRAIAEVKNGSSTYRAASVKYGIPIATICDKVKNRMPVSTKLGRQHFLSHGQEDSLQQYMVTMGKIGYGVTKQDLPFIVKSVLDEAEKEGLTSAEQRVFTNNLPSKGWTYSFLKRHPNLSALTPENLGFQRAYVNEQTIRQWFNGLQKFLSEEHGLDAKTFLSAKNGSRIFNVDESGFPLQETTGKCQVITERSTKNIHRLAPDTRQQITVLSCVSASGDFMKPFVLFPGKKWPKFNLTGVNEDDYDLGHTENGWISTDTFFDWISNLFYPYMKDRVPFPILLFMDGHTAHINIAVSDFCKDHEIILYCFPPHASHILQPLDVSVFGPLKKGWNRSIKDFYLNNRVQMTKTHFFQVFDVAWKEARGKPNNVVSGFRAAGLVPFNVEHVDFSKLLDTKSVEKFKKGNSSHAPSLEESLGLTRALSIVETNLSTAELALYKKRYDEGYDWEDGPLWKIYKGIREALSEKALKQAKGKSTRIRKQSSSESEDEESRAACQAYGGKDRWEDNTAWIGCNTCDAWLHRDCVSEEVGNMTVLPETLTKDEKLFEENYDVVNDNLDSQLYNVYKSLRIMSRPSSNPPEDSLNASVGSSGHGSLVPLLLHPDSENEPDVQDSCRPNEVISTCGENFVELPDTAPLLQTSLEPMNNLTVSRSPKLSRPRPSDENDVHASSIGKSADGSSGSLLKSIANIENSIEVVSIKIDDNLSSISSVSEYAESENSVDAFDGFQALDAPNSPGSSSDDEFEGFNLVYPEGAKKSDAESIAVENTNCEETNSENMSEDCETQNVLDNTYEGFDPFNSIFYNSDKTNSLISNNSIVNEMEVDSSQSIVKETCSKSSTSNAKTVCTSPSKVKLEENDDSDDFIGPNCQAIGCTVSWLETNSPMSKPVNVTNGIVFELSEFAKKIAWEREYVVRWISRIQGVPSELMSISDEDLKKIHMVIKRRKAISVTFSGKDLLKVKLSSFDKEVFHLPSFEFSKNVDASNNISSTITNGREKIDQKLSEKEYTGSGKSHCGSILHSNVVPTTCESASVTAKKAKNCTTRSSNRSNHALISRPDMEIKSASKSTYDVAKNLPSCKMNDKPLVAEISKVTKTSNISSVISSKNKSSQAADPFAYEAENVISDGELIIDESAFSDDDSNESHSFNREKKTSVSQSSLYENDVDEQISQHMLKTVKLSDQSINCSSLQTVPRYPSINSNIVKKNHEEETGVKLQECLKKSLPEKVSSGSKDPTHTQSLGTFASSPIALAVGVVNKKLDPVKMAFGQHIKFASKKGKGDFAVKNVQYPIFELRNNVIGPYCSRVELSVKMLNAPSKKILMTNGMVIELYIFFKERGATLTSLVYKIHQLTTIPLNTDLIQLHMSKIQEVVNTELQKKTEYFLEREFSFISTDAGSVTHVAKIKEPSPAGSSLNLLPKKINSQTSKLSFQDLNVSNEQKDCNDAAAVQKPLEEEEDLDVSMLLDFEKSKGKMGGITRGDIVRLYYSWLQQKNKDKDSVFVIDLLNDVEKLMISRNIDVVRIPVGTLMSSSVKLYEEYKSYRASNPEDALAYLEDDWLEDLNYLISSSKNVRSSIEESSSCKSYNDRNSQDRSAKSVSFCSSTKNSEQISLPKSTNDTVEGRVSSTESRVCLALEKVSTNSSKDETSKSELCSMKDKGVPNKKKNAAETLRKSQLPEKRPADEESKFDQIKSKCCKYSSEILVKDGSEIYPPLPVISSSQFTDLNFEFRIERVVSCRLSSRNGLSMYDYLIEWKGNSPIADTWVEEKDFPPGCIFIVKFWEGNSTRTMDVNEVKDHKKIEDENGEEIHYLVIWHKYNSSSWIAENHFPESASELLCMYKKSHMQNQVLSLSLLSDDTVMVEPFAPNSTKTSAEVNSDDVTQLKKQASQICVEITSGKESNSLEAEESSTGVLNYSSGASDLNKASCSMAGQTSHDIGSQSATKSDLRSPISENIATNQNNASTAVEVSKPSQNLKKDDNCVESSEENECILQRNSVQDSCPSLRKSSRNMDSKQTSNVVCPSETPAQSCSSPQFSDTTSQNTASEISRAKRKPREEFFSKEEKERTMKVLKTIPLGQVLNQNECLQFSDLVAQCMPLNTASNSTLFCGVPQMRYLTNGKLLGMYDEWRKQKANKKADESMKSFGALRAKIKSSMESYGLNYDYDDCLLGVCYSLHFARAGLTSMADIMKFNSSPCTDALKSFKANHDSVKKKYYQNIDPDSGPPEKIFKSVDRVTLNRARQTSMCYDFASNKIKHGLSAVKEALSESDVESRAAVNDDLAELQQGFDFIEKKQKNLSSAIDSYVEDAKNNQAKKTLKKLGYDGDELKDLLSLISQNVQQEVLENQLQFDS